MATRAEVKKAATLARKLKAEGLAMDKISKELKKAGYTGIGGEAYAVGSLYALIARKSKGKRANGASASTEQPLKMKGASARLKGVISILRTDLPAGERIALALMLGEA